MQDVTNWPEHQTKSENTKNQTRQHKRQVRQHYIITMRNQILQHNKIFSQWKCLEMFPLYCDVFIQLTFRWQSKHAVWSTTDNHFLEYDGKAIHITFKCPFPLALRVSEEFRSCPEEIWGTRAGLKPCLLPCDSFGHWVNFIGRK